MGQKRAPPPTPPPTRTPPRRPEGGAFFWKGRKFLRRPQRRCCLCANVRGILLPRHGFPAAATSLLPCNDHASAITEVAKHVVVARGGVVGEDDRPRVGARHPARREVEAAALAQAGAAAVPRSAAVGPVERDETAVEREARRALWGGPAVEDAAALAVAAVAANAAAPPVAVFRMTIESERVPIDPFRLMRPPPWPAPPVPPRRPPLPLSPPAPPVAWLKTNKLSRTSQSVNGLLRPPPWPTPPAPPFPPLPPLPPAPPIASLPWNRLSLT